MDGILLLSKPAGWTSHDLVDAVRRRMGQRAVGHAGTLDPMATGLMVLLLGKGTKLSASFMGLDKDYRGTFRLGIVTDSWDLDGRLLREQPVPALSEEALRGHFADLTGERAWTPPAFSALKRGGRKAYELARSGQAVRMEARLSRIDRLELEAYEEPEVYFSMTCSKGTYVRSVAQELGERLGCGAALSSLVRTRIGGFHLKEAADIQDEDLSRSIRPAS